MRSQTLTATFENWKLRDGGVIRTKFEMLLTLESCGSRNYRWIARIKQTRHPFSTNWAESNLDQAKTYVASQFEKQLTEWLASGPHNPH